MDFSSTPDESPLDVAPLDYAHFDKLSAGRAGKFVFMLKTAVFLICATFLYRKINQNREIPVGICLLLSLVGPLSFLG